MLKAKKWNKKEKGKFQTKILNGQPTIVAENHLNREFFATKPLERLITDITYLPFGGKVLYLSCILDLFNGEIVAYSIGEVQDTARVLDTLNQLTNLSEGVILHSDQGSVYTSAAYQEAVKSKGITRSMSRKGTPQSNRFIPR